MKKRYIAAFTFFCINTLVACQSAPQVTAPVIKAPIPNGDKPSMICTMQYDPVCVKTMTNSIISYQTFSNACMASNSVNAISITKGACGSDATK